MAWIESFLKVTDILVILGAFSLFLTLWMSLMSSIAQLATHEEKSHHDDGQLDLQSRTLISTGKLDTPT